MSGEPLSDDEVLLHRIPPGDPWLEPSGRLTSANFKLNKKKKELGVSAYRQTILDETAVIEKPGTIPNSFIVTATVGEIRSLTNAQGECRRLDVFPADDKNNPGHVEIRGPKPGHLSKSDSKALRDLFARSLHAP